MYSTDPQHRNAYITGLRDLADYLDANSGVPVPAYGTSILLFASLAEKGGLEQITDIAAHLDAPVLDTTADMGSYRAFRSFGPVSYEAVSHTIASMAVHHAEASYQGCVTPDSPVLTCPACGSADIRETRADDCDAGDCDCACAVFSCDDCAATWRPDDA